MSAALCLDRLPAGLRRGLAAAALMAAALAAQAAGPLAQALGTAPAASTAPGAVVETPQVRAELLAHAPEGLGPGKPMWLGLKLQHQPHWHTYWKNPGDSGLPTRLEWTLPPGVQAGPIDWPVPHRLRVGPLVNYGFEGELLLPVALTLPADWRGEGLEVALRADWLVCREECIPDGGDFRIHLPAQGALAAHRGAFEASWAQRPQALAGLRAVATHQPAPAAAASAPALDDGHGPRPAPADPGALALRVDGLPAALQGRPVELYSEVEALVDHAAEPALRWAGGVLQAAWPLSPQRSSSPASLPVVLRVLPGPAGGESVLLRVEAALSGLPPVEAVELPPALQAALAAAGARAAAPAEPPALSLALLLGALLGGALLNLMPCVFPVLSLKALALAQHGEDRRALIGGGLAYTAGVILSFLLLAGALLALRAAGEQLGWGFQLQSPAFIAGMAVLFTLIGLNLAGVFEIGGLLPAGLGGLRARHPRVDDALSGVLAVAVASPCTAPFMGAALGAAVALPTAQALLVFALLGLGMALPYLLLSALPGLARRLPRPGLWMLRFKMLMAFPMFATVVWLGWVLGLQTGVDGLVGLLGLLLALAFAAWAWATPWAGALGRTVWRGLGLALLAASLGLAWPAWQAGAGAGTVGAAAARPLGEWQPWSAERVAAAQAAGQPVFVDFTAAWCVTCQYNKRTVLADAAVLAALEGKRVLKLRADWTMRDAAITAELGRLGRSGVPVYALFPGRPAGAAQLLSELPSREEILQAVAAL